MDRKEVERQIKEAADRELLYNILLSKRRFAGDDDMPDEEFIIEQSRDFGCRDELKRRGYTDEKIDELNKQTKERIKKGEVECPKELRFLLDENLVL